MAWPTSLPQTPAIRFLSAVLGVDVPAKIKELVNPLLLDIPDAEIATPVEGVVQMDCETRHVSVARHETDQITVLLPDVTDDCAKGKVYGVTITSEEGDNGAISIKANSGAPDAALSDGTYLFANVNGLVWAFQNDYEVWAAFISLISTVIGAFDNSEGESIGSAIGARADEASGEIATASLFALVKDLQARVGVIEGE